MFITFSAGPIIRKINAVFASYPEIQQAIIYGSRAKETHREGSDIDIVLIGDQLTEDIRSKIWLDLDDLNTPYLIDLSVYHHLTSENLKDHIQHVGKILYTQSESNPSSEPSLNPL